MIANYHTHTRWCRHADGEIEDYIREALRRGLKALAITDHVPHRGNFDPRRMQWEEFAPSVPTKRCRDMINMRILAATED